MASARLRMRVPVGDCRASGDAPRPGTAVSVRLPEGAPGAVAGLLHGGERRARRPRGGGRASCACTGTSRAAGAAALVGALTRAAQRATACRSGSKVADHPFRLERCDAAVLYLPGDRLRRAATALLEDAGDGAAGAPAAARSRRSRSSWPPASGWPRIRRQRRELRRPALRAARRRDRARPSRRIDAGRRAARCGRRPLRGGRGDDRRALPRAVARAAAMSSDDAFLAAAAVDRPAHRGRCGLAPRPLQLDGRGRGRAAQPWRVGVPRARAEPLRRDRGRRPVPRPARRGDRRRRRCAAPRSGRCATRSRARRRSRRPGATASTPGSLGIALGGRARRRLLGDDGAARAVARVAGARRAAVRGPDRCPDVIDGQRGSDPRAARARRARLDDRRCSSGDRATGDAADRSCDGHARTAGRGRIPGAATAHHLCGLVARRGGDRLGAARGCTRRPATSGSATAPTAPSRTSGRGSMPGSGTWPDLRSPAQRRGGRIAGAVDGDRHVVPRRGRHRAHAAAGRATRRPRSTPDQPSHLERALMPRSMSATISRSATARPARRTCCCAGGTRRRGDGARAGGGRAVRGRSATWPCGVGGRDAARPVPRAERDRLVAAAAVTTSGSRPRSGRGG